MMSILPQASIAVWTSSSGAPSFVRSPAKTAVSPAISPAVCSAASPSRSLTRTFAPCSASSSAVARPMPRAEPVTIATLSSRTPMSVPPRRVRRRHSALASACGGAASRTCRAGPRVWSVWPWRELRKSPIPPGPGPGRAGAAASARRRSPGAGCARASASRRGASGLDPGREHLARALRVDPRAVLGVQRRGVAARDVGGGRHLGGRGDACGCARRASARPSRTSSVTAASPVPIEVSSSPTS